MTETYNTTIPGLGCTVGYSTTSGGSATAVGQLKSIDGTNYEVGMFDSTGLASSSAEQVPTIFKAGDFGFTMWFNPADTTHAAMIGYMQAKTLLYWTFTFSNPIGPGATTPGSAKTHKFAAYISGWNLSGFEPESDAEVAVKLGITGDVTTN